MKLFILLFFLTVSIASCNGLISSGKGSPNGGASSSSSASGGNSNAPGGTGSNTPTPSMDQLIDTSKLKDEMKGLMNSIATGKPDTAQLKRTAADVLTTTATVLSDSGINALGGNSADPSQKAATEALKKMRNGMGITPGSLDSMRKSAAQLQKN